MNGKQSKILRKTRATKQQKRLWKTLSPEAKYRFRKYVMEYDKAPWPSFMSVIEALSEKSDFD